MNKYENAMKLMEEYCGRKDNLIALATIALSTNAVGNPRPAVRMFDAYYKDGVFYVSTDANKNKMLEIGENNEITKATSGNVYGMGYVEAESDDCENGITGCIC